MERDREAQFREWAKPPGKTEEDRCQNAASAVRNAIKASDKLRSRGVSVFVQGSYRNNTNVRKDSDVDVGILCTDTFFYHLPEGGSSETFGITPASYQYRQYRDEIEEALVNYFGRSAVKRGNKAFDVHETSYHVEADVAAFFEHRRYLSSESYLSGVELRTDRDGASVINWPEQQYANGCGKNTTTGTRFKSVVRCLKALSNEMAEAGVAGSVHGFLIECLVWNVPNDYFGHAAYASDVRESLAYLFNSTMTDAECSEWGEVSELMYLFKGRQRWTRAQAHEFVSNTWDYVGFEG